MSVRNALLGLLANGPLHGYELKASFETRLLPESPLNYGQVYASLDRLERDGLVEHEVVVQEEKPDKKVFRITPRGREELDRWLDAPSPPSVEVRNETFLKLAVARVVEGADPRRVVSEERRACFRRLREVTEARVAARTGDSSAAAYLLLELAALRLEAFATWLDRCEEALDAELI